MTKQEPQDGRGVLFVVLMFQDHEHTAQFFLSVFCFSRQRKSERNQGAVEDTRAGRASAGERSRAQRGCGGSDAEAW